MAFPRIPVAAAAVAVGLLLLRNTTPGVPPPGGEFVFQPEPRQPIEQPQITLPPSSSAPAPSPQAASCAGLQRFANYEYGRRFRDGKLAELLSFSGFDARQPIVSGEGVITCSGGEYLRRSAKAERSCRNVLITYDTRANTLSHNVQYRYLESGLVAQCSEGVRK